MIHVLHNAERLKLSLEDSGQTILKEEILVRYDYKFQAMNYHEKLRAKEKVLVIKSNRTVGRERNQNIDRILIRL